MVRRWPPRVAPEVARRRTIFFAGVGILIVAGSASPLLDRDLPSGSGQTTRLTATVVRPQTGCTLRVGSSTLTLTPALAMRLTDQAGRDQNAARPLTATTAAVAGDWSAEARSAGVIALALRGYDGPALACAATLPSAHAEAMETDGLTLRANAMWDAIKTIFGPLPAGGFMPGGVTTGHVPGSAHYEGRAIDFFYRPITTKTIQHGWVLAQWAVAHAQVLQIATVIFDAQVWTPASWDHRNWQPYLYPEGPTTNVTLLHYDHVHVDVQRGSLPALTAAA
jgi:hypothetical protein